MTIKQFEIWTADLNPRHGTESGKVRPVLVVQTNLLNKIHPSTIICPITTLVQKDSEILRVHVKKGQGKIKNDCDIMIDQVRAIDNTRFKDHIADLTPEQIDKVRENLKIVLELE